MAKKIFLTASFSLPLAAVALAVLTLNDRSLMQWCFSRGSYYLILLLSLFWAGTLLQWIKTEPKSWSSIFRRSRTGILFSFILAGIVFVSVKPYFRILSDETNLLDISQTMTYEKRIEKTLMGKWYDFNFYPESRTLPKRPLIYPFLVHSLHTLFGYRPSHAFAVNFLALGSILSLVFILFRKGCGPPWAYAAVLLVAAQPVLSLTATSGGFDLFQGLFILLCFAALLAFLESPSAVRFQVLWINLLMLANVRYESPLFFAIILFFLLLFGYVKKDFFCASWIYPLTPFWCLPFFWQRILISKRAAWERLATEVKFSFDYFLENTVIFFKSAFAWNYDMPYASLVNALGILSLVHLTGLFVRKKWPLEKPHRHFAIIVVSALSCYWILMLSYFYGNAAHGAYARFFVPVVLGFSLLAVLFLYRIETLRERPVPLLILAACMFLLYHPVAVESRLHHTLTLPRRYRAVLEFLKKQEGHNLLVISDRPGLYTVHQYGGIKFSHANSQKKWILKEHAQRRYDAIVVIQEIDHKTQTPAEDMTLDPAYTLETVLELEGNESGYLRISRVVRGDDEQKTEDDEKTGDRKTSNGYDKDTVTEEARSREAEKQETTG